MSLRVTLVVAKVNLRTPGLSHFFANARFRFRCSFAGHVAAPTDRTASKGLEVSKGQFPFPLAPEFWGSWNNS
jgi:hypothetical protein